MSSGIAGEMKAEKESSYDSSISSCRENLRNEVRRCENKIDQLESTVRSLERQIRDQGGTIYFWE